MSQADPAAIITDIAQRVASGFANSEEVTGVAWIGVSAAASVWTELGGDQDPFQAFLYQAGRNAVIDSLRQSGSGPTTVTLPNDPDLGPSGPSPDKHAQDLAAGAELLLSMMRKAGLAPNGKLSKSYRLAWLRFILGHGNQEIAERWPELGYKDGGEVGHELAFIRRELDKVSPAEGR